MKYPLDDKGIEDIGHDILLHHRAQAQIIEKLIDFLAEALQDADPDTCDWYEDVEKLVKARNQRKIEFENHRFNQTNGYNLDSNSPFPAEPHERINHIDIKREADLNAHEAQEFGGELSEEELANHFREKPTLKVLKKKKEKELKLNKMSMAEIESWEAAQDNSTDIYKVSARIKNAARMAVKANLTPQGDMVTNTFAHLIKGLYDLADTIPDKEIKIKLVNFAKKQEETPAGLIAALSAGVKIST